MARCNCEPLSAQDNSFLVAEGPATPMHVSAIQVFGVGPLGNERGGIDIEIRLGDDPEALAAPPEHGEGEGSLGFSEYRSGIHRPPTARRFVKTS